MELTIHALQELRLTPCKHLITKKNASLVATATHALLERSTITPRAYADIAADVPVHHPGSTPPDILCTWRPRYCLDVFLHVSKDPREAFLGVVMHGNTPTVEYFRCEEQLCVTAAAGGIIFGHLTADTNHDGLVSSKLLLYDGIPADSTGISVPIQSRYGWLQSLEEDLKSLKIADTNLVVQWIGSPHVHAEIVNMKLPHAQGGIIILRSEVPYQLYAF